MSRKTTNLFVFLGTVALIVSCGSKQAPPQGPPPAIPVTVEPVRKSLAIYFEEYPGTVTALNQTELRAQVTGYVTGIYFSDGDNVKKGQKLYSIDQQLYSANYQQALANLQLQETNLLKAQKDADRFHELDKKDAIAKQQVDYADAALDAAKKQVDAAKANVNAVRATVGFATITAPFTGTIGISQVRAGTAVVAGQTILNTISTDNPIGVDFAIDQQEFYRFNQLKQEGQKLSDSTFSIAFGNDIYPYFGKIGVLDRAVDAQTGTLKTRLVFPNDQKMLKPGMSTTVRILHNSDDHSILIPYKAVTEQLGEFFVYVVGDSNKVTQRKLALGKQIGSDIIVKTGLSEGEKIVVLGVQNLREGAFIKPEEPGIKK